MYIYICIYIYKTVRPQLHNDMSMSTSLIARIYLALYPMLKPENSGRTGPNHGYYCPDFTRSNGYCSIGYKGWNDHCLRRRKMFTNSAISVSRINRNTNIFAGTVISLQDRQFVTMIFLCIIHFAVSPQCYRLTIGTFCFIKPEANSGYLSWFFFSHHLDALSKQKMAVCYVYFGIKYFFW